ncbi:cupin domain-containing protein [Rhodocytophaga rosea]|uniref:Cupin domain-containing protein n=1 Tax=Rhodocytophaga rosea TaxID=2704465 RepID=A0A6C0GH94_9BACT|nr:cupin domain-containing protein [Rhodocytophaga rosea]QHT67368.1 cupin domain-containing protein [Rhodocytophaga rosea]
MKLNKEAIPVAMQAPGTIMRNLPGYGGMTVAFNQMPAGTDLGPLLQGLKNNSCQCPHWGYVLEGEIVMKYDDGTEETLMTGDVFYMQPGHTAVVKKDTKLIDFSPEKQLKEVLEHVAKKMAEFS